MKRTATFFLAILAGLASAAGSARADIFAYAVDVLDNLNLVDLTTHTASVIGPTNAPLEGLALSPGGALYGSGANGLLYSMDRTTGAATPIGNTGLFDVEGLVFNGSTLLATNTNNPTSVYTIDPTTAASTLLVTTNPGEGKARALALMNDTTALIVSDSPVTQSLVSIDLTTGMTAVIGTIGDEVSVFAMAFGPGGVLYGLDKAGNEIIISTTDGSTTTVGNTGGQFWLDMTIIPPAAVPEPSSLRCWASRARSDWGRDSSAGRGADRRGGAAGGAAGVDGHPVSSLDSDRSISAHPFAPLNAAPGRRRPAISPRRDAGASTPGPSTNGHFDPAPIGPPVLVVSRSSPTGSSAWRSAWRSGAVLGGLYLAKQAPVRDLGYGAFKKALVQRRDQDGPRRDVRAHRRAEGRGFQGGAGRFRASRIGMENDAELPGLLDKHVEGAAYEAEPGPSLVQAMGIPLVMLGVAVCSDLDAPAPRRRARVGHGVRQEPAPRVRQGRGPRHVRRRRRQRRGRRGAGRGRRVPPDSREVPGARRADSQGRLLVGPPGTGKTLLARAVAGEAGCRSSRSRARTSSRCSSASARPGSATCSPQAEAEGPVPDLHRRARRPGQGPRQRHGRRQPRRARPDPESAPRRDGRVHRELGRDRHGGHEPPRDARPRPGAARSIRPPRHRRPARHLGPRGDPQGPREEGRARGPDQPPAHRRDDGRVRRGRPGEPRQRGGPARGPQGQGEGRPARVRGGGRAA